MTQKEAPASVGEVTMIQVNDTNELKSKVTKLSLAQVADKEANRLDSQQVLYLAGIFAIVVMEFFLQKLGLQKLGWYLLPVVIGLAVMFHRRSKQITDLEGRASPVRIKSINPKRDSWR